MRGKRIIFLFALLMAAAGAWAQDYHQWESGGCTVTFDDSSSKMTVSKTPGGSGAMADYNDGTNTFKLTDNFDWGTAYAFAVDANDNPKLGDWPGTELEVVEEYGRKRFVINVPEGAVMVIVNNGQGTYTQEITDFTRYTGYSMNGGKDDQGAYRVTPDRLETPWGAYIIITCKIVIEDGVTHIGDNAFMDAGQLEKVIMKTTTPPTLGYNAFDNMDGKSIKIPASAVGDYENAEGWSQYENQISLTHSVSLADGTEDAANWTGKENDDTPETFPLLVDGDNVVTAIYGGSLKVKKVTVKKK